MEEKQLILRAKRGDPDAFGELVLAHQDKVYTLAFHLVRDREEAADLAQEAFLKAWRSLATFQGESSFSTWMHRLTTNICLDHLRKQSRRRQVTPAISLDDEEAGWTEPADPGQDPQEKLEIRERKEALAKGLEELPEHHRRVLLLREVSGLSYQEIARELELDLGTVKSRIARARTQLRKILSQPGNLFEDHASNDMKEQRGR